MPTNNELARKDEILARVLKLDPTKLSEADAVLTDILLDAIKLVIQLSNKVANQDRMIATLTRDVDKLFGTVGLPCPER